MPQDRWIDVKGRVEGLGLKLKLHLQQEADEADEADEDRQPGNTRAAFEEFGEKLEDAFEAFGNAAKDPAVRTDVKEIGLLLKDALQETLSGVGAEVGERFGKGGTDDTTSEADQDAPPLKASPDDDTQDTVDES